MSRPRLLFRQALLLCALSYSAAVAGCSSPDFVDVTTDAGPAHDPDSAVDPMEMDAGTGFNPPPPAPDDEDGGADTLDASVLDFYRVDAPRVIRDWVCTRIVLSRDSELDTYDMLSVGGEALYVYSDSGCTHEIDSYPLGSSPGANPVIFTEGQAEVELWVRGELVRRVDAPPANSKHTELMLHGRHWTMWPMEVRRGATQVARAGAATCFVLVDGPVQCVGDSAQGTAGQLGNQHGRYLPTPSITAAPEQRLYDLAMAGSSGCGLHEGQVYCWGDNGRGQLGRSGAGAAVPSLVPGLGDGVYRLGMGGEHACAVSQDSLYCWGANDHGQSAMSDLAQVGPSKVDLPFAYPPQQVAPGVGFTCVRAADDVWCWGANDAGQLGNGTLDALSEPTLVAHTALARNVAQIAGAGLSVCALTHDGDVYCWGDGRFGVASGGLEVTQPVLMLEGVEGLKYLDVGPRSACVASTSEAYCWGQNVEGSLGTGATTPVAAPSRVEGMPLGEISAIATDGEPGAHCALVDELAYCWGVHRHAELGIDARLGDHLLPTRQPSLDVYDALSGGAGYSCGMRAGRVFCWGAGEHGQLGNGSAGQGSAAYLHEAPSAPVIDGAANELAFGDGFVLARSGVHLQHWGRDVAGRDVPLHTTPADLTIGSGHVDAISAAARHACVVVTGTITAPGVYCWGDNTGGLAGVGRDDSKVEQPELIALPPGAHMASLDTHDDGSCAIANGEVYCWGPAFGNDAPEKFAVEDFTNFEQVAVYAGGRVCALRETGDLWCFQQRGEPKQLGSDFVQLEAGASHACGLKQVGSEQHLYCWGENRHGQLGVGDRDRRSEPTAVLGLVGPVSMFDITQADAPATCAHDDEGMKCWGNNTSRHFAPVPYVQPTPTLIEAWQNLE